MRKTEEILIDILAKRGITEAEDISEFLSDKPKKTYDPFLLLNMEAGVDLLLSEIKNGNKICIYGDYDADGVTSICVLSHVIGMLTDNFTYYIPSRFEEGYGLNKRAIKKIYDDGVGLMITVDCGSVSYDEVEYAKELGMKVIVTDHHSIENIKADCILINPKQSDCTYPFKELAGCGVAFKLAQAIQQKTGLPKSVINDVLDLVAVGTVGDVVSLTDENRTIVKYGLNKINAGGRKALKHLTKSISLPWITSENISFGIAPHINAAGRMASAKEAVELFIAKDDATIEEKVRNLIYFNTQRKKKQDEAYNIGISMISEDDNFILLHMENIHEGIGGIVAGKIKESVGKPVAIVTPSGEGYLKGTARSIDKIDLFKLLKNQESLFERFGGHRSACGFLLKEENLDLLRKGLESDVTKMLEENPDLFEKEVSWDIELTSEEITLDLAQELKKIEPFGQGNPKPIAMLKDVYIDQVRFMGEDKTHARFLAKSPYEKAIECVLFKRAQELKEMLLNGMHLDVSGTIEFQRWNGKEKVQFIVEEIVLCR